MVLIISDHRPPSLVPDFCKLFVNLIYSANIWPRDLETLKAAFGHCLLPVRSIRKYTEDI